MERWWTATGGPAELDATERLLLSPVGEPKTDATQMFLAWHRYGSRLVSKAASQPLPSRALLDSTMLAASDCFEALAEPVGASVSKHGAVAAASLVKSVMSDTVVGAHSLYDRMRAASVPEPVALERVALVFGVPASLLGEYATKACLPVVPPPVIVHEADKAVMTAAAAVGERHTHGSVAKAHAFREEMVNRDDAGRFAEKESGQPTQPRPVQRVQRQKKVRRAQPLPSKQVAQPVPQQATMSLAQRNLLRSSLTSRIQGATARRMEINRAKTAAAKERQRVQQLPRAVTEQQSAPARRQQAGDEAQNITYSLPSDSHAIASVVTTTATQAKDKERLFDLIFDTAAQGRQTILTPSQVFGTANRDGSNEPERMPRLTSYHGEALAEAKILYHNSAPDVLTNNRSPRYEAHADSILKAKRTNQFHDLLAAAGAGEGQISSEPLRPDGQLIAANEQLLSLLTAQPDRVEGKTVVLQQRSGKTDLGDGTVAAQLLPVGLEPAGGGVSAADFDSITVLFPNGELREHPNSLQSAGNFEGQDAARGHLRVSDTDAYVADPANAYVVWDAVHFTRHLVVPMQAAWEGDLPSEEVSHAFQESEVNRDELGRFAVESGGGSLKPVQRVQRQRKIQRARPVQRKESEEVPVPAPAPVSQQHLPRRNLLREAALQRRAQQIGRSVAAKPAPAAQEQSLQGRKVEAISDPRMDGFLSAVLRPAIYEKGGYLSAREVADIAAYAVPEDRSQGAFQRISDEEVTAQFQAVAKPGVEVPTGLDATKLFGENASRYGGDQEPLVEPEAELSLNNPLAGRETEAGMMRAYEQYGIGNLPQGGKNVVLHVEMPPAGHTVEGSRYKLHWTTDKAMTVEHAVLEWISPR